MDALDLLALPSDDREVISLEQYRDAAERARVLSRLIEMDPEDDEARDALADLSSQGLDVPDAEWLLGITSDFSQSTELSAEIVEHVGDDDAWIKRLFDESEAYGRIGLYAQALELLQMVLRLDPRHDVARARFFELSAKRAGRRRGDETLRVRAAR